MCSYLSTTGFIFRCEWATLLDGRDEGLYGWVTVNYLLDSLYPGGGEPSGIIDLGGGSVQIVFPTSTSVAPEGYTQQLDFAGRKHRIYVKSHLGFGLDAARTAVLDQLNKRYVPWAHHPCLPRGASVTHKGVVMIGTGDYKRCKKVTKRLFEGDDHESCPFGKDLCSFEAHFSQSCPSPFTASHTCMTARRRSACSTTSRRRSGLRR